ncbi:argininosuccinate lyase [Anaerolineae bacterium]|nr:argininosuccinate lyase [Anaerolineae bacterium]
MTTHSTFPHPAYARRVLAPNFEQTKTYLVPAMLAATRAHLVMLVRQNILDRATGQMLLRGLQSLESEGVRDVIYDGKYEDLFFFMEHRLGELTSEEAVGNMQVARSRNDLDGTMCRWVVRERMLSLLQAINNLRACVIGLARQHVDTLMPGYTHTQPAQPTTLAHYLGAVTAFLERDAARVQSAFARVNLSPLGAVAFTTTGFPIDRALAADLLGFDAPVENSYDAVGGADYQTEIAGVVQTAAGGLSRLATDLLFWATQEAGALRIGDEFVQISSIMPQKRNPVVLEHVRTQLGYLYADAQAVFTLHHNAPLGDVNDVEDPIYRPLFRMLDYAIGVYELLDAVLASATWNVERLAARAADGFTTATELADTLVREAKLPFRTAHRVVAQLVRTALTQNLAPREIRAKHVDDAAHQVLGHSLGLSDQIVREALDARHFVALRAIPGGPAPDSTRTIIARQSAQLERDVAWRADHLTRLEQAQARLDAAMQTI